MANQSPDRRIVLEMMAKAAIASQFPGFSRWVFAAAHQHKINTPVLPRPTNYQPLFFTVAEYRSLEVLTEIIIPKDESPGAKDAGVSEFIDFMATHGEEEIRKPMRDGLGWLDGRSKKIYGHVFVELAPDQQTEILKKIAYGKQTEPEDVEGQEFFRLIRRYTVMGYYTSRIGLEELDYPGLKLYSQSPACSHIDDPEHRHLPPLRF
jgi:gluconate 2-dehydrogenase gamma chain